MKNDILVIGLGTFGFSLASRLYHSGEQVMAVDIRQHLVNKIKDDVTVAISADVTDSEVLESLDPAKFDYIILASSSNLETSVLVLTQLIKHNVKYIIAKASTQIQKEILLKLGADEVILSEDEMARRLASRLSHPNIKEIFSLEPDVRLVSVKVPEQFAGKTIRELNLRKKYKITVLMIKEGNKSVVVNSPDLKLNENDELFITGNESDINKIFG